MIFRSIFIILLVVSLFVESSLLAFPCIVLFSLLYFFFFDEIGTYIVIFIASVILDSFMLHAIGYSALFLFAFMGVFIVLEKLFTIKLNMLIVAAAVLLGVEGYREYAHYPFLMGPMLVLILGLLFSFIVQKWLTQKGGLLHA